MISRSGCSRRTSRSPVARSWAPPGMLEWRGAGPGSGGRGAEPAGTTRPGCQSPWVRPRRRTAAVIRWQETGTASVDTSELALAERGGTPSLTATGRQTWLLRFWEAGGGDGGLVTRPRGFEPRDACGSA